MTKTCTKCKESKLVEFFRAEAHRYDGLSPWCKACKNQASYQHQKDNPEQTRATQARYYAKHPDRAWTKQLLRLGITPSEYYIMLNSQNGVCAICHKLCKSGKRLAVDHNHSTGKVRGLLCRDCNTSLGKFHDSFEIVSRAADYLSRDSGKVTIFPLTETTT